MTAIPLDGANVAITGAARGIGLETAAEFMRRGARVALGDIDEPAVADAARSLGEGAHGFALDVSDRDSFAAFLTSAEVDIGPLNVLVNNAGVMPTGRFLSEPDAVTETTIGVNFWGPIWGMKLALPAMLERGSGHVVNVASLMGKFYLPGVATYSSAKYGVVGLSAAVRDELHGTGVTVTTVLPSAVETELISGIKLPAALPRVKPEDVARAIADSCRKRQPEVSVPGWLGNVAPVAELAPSRVVGLVRRLAGHDRALEADPAERAAYEERARDPRLR
jgi:NAD(P)-dependent dehydrogenase (short-subunit alcohol dehydrogenase family)